MTRYKIYILNLFSNISKYGIKNQKLLQLDSEKKFHGLTFQALCDIAVSFP